MSAVAPASADWGTPTANGAYSPWLIAVLVASATFMEVLDVTIVAVALPDIAGNLGTDVDAASWTVTGYLMANAIMLPLSGFLAVFIGRKRFFLLSLAGFTLASALCGLATSLGALIVFRILQGLCGAGLQPIAQAILADTFPPEKRGQGFALFGMAVVVAPALGPTLGGWITDQFGWHWNFLINVPVGILVLALTTLLVKDPPWEQAQTRRWQRSAVRIDHVGFWLTAIGIGALEFFVDEGQDENWFASHMIVLAALVAVAALVALVFWEWRRDYPVVEVRLLRNPGFAIANVLIFFTGVCVVTTTQVLPQFAQQLLGYTATDAGLALTAGGLILIVMMPIMGRLVTRIQAKYLVATGLLIEAASFYFLYGGFATGLSFWGLALARLGQMAGVPFLFIPILTAAFVDIPAEKTNQASALINMNRALGGSVGIALVQTELARAGQYHQSNLVSQLTAFHEPFQQALQQMQTTWAGLGAGVDAASQQAYAALYRLVQTQAAMLAYLDSFIYLGLAALLVTPLALILPRVEIRSQTQASH